MSNPGANDPLAALKAHIATLPKEVQEQRLDDPQQLFELIERGDAISAMIAVQNGADVEVTDRDGMTPLHHAAANDMKLMTAILTQEANAGPWMRDRHGRLPLDIARNAGNQELGNALERLTYASVYRDEVDGPVTNERIATFDAKRQELGSPASGYAIEVRGDKSEIITNITSHNNNSQEL
jgi:ankyrin repeat protein